MTGVARSVIFHPVVTGHEQWQDPDGVGPEPASFKLHGSTAWNIAGLDWVLQQRKTATLGQPAVVHYSSGGEPTYSYCLNKAANNLVNGTHPTPLVIPVHNQGVPADRGGACFWDSKKGQWNDAWNASIVSVPNTIAVGNVAKNPAAYGTDDAIRKAWWQLPAGSVLTNNTLYADGAWPWSRCWPTTRRPALRGLRGGGGLFGRWVVNALAQDTEGLLWLVAGPQGQLWCQTTGGWARWRQGRWSRLSPEDEAPGAWDEPRVDGRGRAWGSSERGLLREGDDGRLALAEGWPRPRSAWCRWSARRPSRRWRAASPTRCATPSPGRR